MTDPSGPAATGRTRPGAKSPTVVRVKPQRTVTYTFQASSSAGLRIPYAVAVDATVLPAFRAKPARVAGGGGKIRVFASPGSRVSLFLNSDARAGWRQQPVYAVTVGDTTSKSRSPRRPAVTGIRTSRCCSRRNLENSLRWTVTQRR